MSDRKTDALRLQMINGQLRPNDVNDLDLLAAFAATPRERFVSPAHANLAYADADVLSTGPKGRRLLSPRTLGLLLKAAAPQRGERALTVGGGPGYGAAILSRLGLHVTALETDASAVRAANPEGVDGVEGPLAEPPAGKGPYDVIVIEGAFEVEPDRLIESLADGGRLVGVRAHAGAKRVALYEKSGGGVSARDAFDATADVLPGFERSQSFTF